MGCELKIGAGSVNFSCEWEWDFGVLRGRDVRIARGIGGNGITIFYVMNFVNLSGIEIVR